MFNTIEKENQKRAMEAILRELNIEEHHDFMDERKKSYYVSRGKSLQILGRNVEENSNQSNVHLQNIDLLERRLDLSNTRIEKLEQLIEVFIFKMSEEATEKLKMDFFTLTRKYEMHEKSVIDKLIEKYILKE